MELEVKGVQLGFELLTIRFTTLPFNHEGSWKNATIWKQNFIDLQHPENPNITYIAKKLKEIRLLIRTSYKQKENKGKWP
jgi:hypothetical protein